MDTTKRNEVIRPAMKSIGDCFEEAVTRAYAMGVKDGEAKAAADFAGMLNQRFGPQFSPAVVQTPAPPQIRPPEAQSSERRKYGYGVVSGVIRHIIYNDRFEGKNVADIIARCSADFAVDIHKGQVREALKRMSAADEIRSQNRKWFPTDKFRKDLIVSHAENEAPSGDAAGASETGETAIPPSDDRPGFRLVS